MQTEMIDRLFLELSQFTQARTLREIMLKGIKDNAYLERNKCVALICHMALELGLNTGRTKTAIEGWAEDWHGCVYVDLPSGQVSWHYHDSQARLFDRLPIYFQKWDGHNTLEKYRRVADAF